MNMIVWQTIRRRIVLLIALGALAAASGKSEVGAAGSADQWGTLKGRFLYDGKAPTPKKLAVTKDVEFCGKHMPVDESLVVGDDGGLANVIVHIRPPRGKKLAVHPDYEASATDQVKLDNNQCRFNSHITLLRTSQTLVVANSDSVGHNTNVTFPLINQQSSFNQLIPAGGSIEVKVPKDEGRPATVNCNIHPWMSGYLLVRDDPYTAVSAPDGTFEIRNIPVGQHEFQFWQEKSGFLKDIEFKGGKADRRGRAKIKITSGVVDLGEIKVSPKLFAGA
jgi:hypothetical protein